MRRYIGAVLSGYKLLVILSSLILIFPVSYSYAKIFPTITMIKKTFPSIVEIEARANTVADISEIENRPRTFWERITAKRDMRPAVCIKKGVGVIITDTGIIVTNAHVVKDMTDITVSVEGGKTTKGRLAGIFTEDDLAFIKITPPFKLSPLEIRDSALLKKGSEVFTVGNSRLLKKTTIHGKVIGFVYVKTGDGDSDKPIRALKTRFDSHSYRGDSGSPVFDNRARFMGVLFAALNESSYYSAVLPSNLIKKDFRKLFPSEK